MPKVTDSTSFARELKKLNERQREAVEALQGPVLVVAGPGTGKTQVLALRIANILQQGDINPSNILCLTFTESGVVAMRKRLAEIIGAEGYYVRVHTFHSFCNEVIQSFPEKFAFTKELVQLDDLSRVKIIQSIIDELPTEQTWELRPFYNPYTYQADIVNSIQTLKREGVTPVEFEEIANSELADLEANPQINAKTGKPTTAWSASRRRATKNKELAQLYARYQEVTAQKGLYDYEDMILYVINKWREDDELLAYYQERYLHVLVDEYQDTNGAQNKLLYLWGSFDKSPNIFAVGDDDQAIYRFQGANVGNLIEFADQFENVKKISLEVNYRSSQLILDAAGALVANNKQRLTELLPDLSKDLTAGRDLSNNPVEIAHLSHEEVETKFIVQKISELHSAGLPYKDMAILYRKHADANDIIDALLKANIPVQISAGANILENKYVHQLLTLLHAVKYASKDRDFLLSQVLFYGFVKVDRLEVFKLIQQAGKNKTELWESLVERAEGKQLTLDLEAKQLSLEQFTHLLLSWQAGAANLCIYELVEKIAQESGFLNFVFAKEDITKLDDIAAVNTFFGYVRQINRRNRFITLAEFLADIDLMEENKLGISRSGVQVDTEGVNLMTIHGAKGLEFKQVFMIKLYESNWEGRKTRKMITLPDAVFSQTVTSAEEDVESASSIEDERRLFYVGLTRAKENIYLTYADNYGVDKEAKEVATSLFVNEIPAKLTKSIDVASYEEFDPLFVRSQLSHTYNFDYTAQEKQFLAGLVSEFKLSASSLNEYIECPLKFKYNRLLKLPKPPERILALGTAIHFALEHLMRNLMKGTKQDLAYAIFLFTEELKRQVLSPEDFEHTLAEGTKLLTDYVEHYKDSWEVPVEVEYGFYGRHIQLTSPHVEPIPLTGKLDKLTWLDKDQFTVKVTDYKTSSPKSQNEIKGETKTSEGNIYRQLVFYKLLAQLDDRFRPSPNAPKYQIEQVEVDFIKPNSRGLFKKEVFEISPADVEELKAKIVDVMTHIRQLDFGGSSEYPLCNECEYCKML